MPSKKQTAPRLTLMSWLSRQLDRHRRPSANVSPSAPPFKAIAVQPVYDEPDLIRAWREEAATEYERFLASIPQEVPDPVPARAPDARNFDGPPPPDADDQTVGEPAVLLQAGLLGLREALVYSEKQAGEVFGNLLPLVTAGYLVVAASAVGPLVCLGREGRRMVQAGQTHKTFSIVELENLMYFRRAAAMYRWVVLAEPRMAQGRSRLLSHLDRLGVIVERGQRKRVMARVTAGGYAARTVTQYVDILYGGLVAENEVLLVLTPDLAKIGRMRRKGRLEIREFHGR